MKEWFRKIFCRRNHLAGWREVGKDEILPVGSSVRMDLKTGKNYVKVVTSPRSSSPLGEHDKQEGKEKK